MADDNGGPSASMADRDPVHEINVSISGIATVIDLLKLSKPNINSAVELLEDVTEQLVGVKAAFKKRYANKVG